MDYYSIMGQDGINSTSILRGDSVLDILMRDLLVLSLIFMVLQAQYYISLLLHVRNMRFE